MSEAREIFIDFLSNFFGSIGEWLEQNGAPFTDDQQRLLSDLLAGKDWQGLA